MTSGGQPVWRRHSLKRAILSWLRRSFLLCTPYDLGDPDGAALLASNVALRHDFGFGLDDGEMRARTLWALPRQDFLPGVPWHVTGALVGLDVALAPLALRRINVDAAADAPRVPSNERDGFAVGLSLMNGRDLKDADRDAITAAISRGERRVAALVAGSEPLQTLADALALDGWRQRQVRWLLENDPSQVRGSFTLAEMVVLGGGAGEAGLDAWGGPAIYASACLCTRFDSPVHWQLLDGRPQIALMSSIVPDLNLRVAVVLGELRLPSALARPVLSAAIQDFVDEALPLGSHDWLGMSRAAQAVPRQRIEDYVAVAASVGGPLIPEAAGSATSR